MQRLRVISLATIQKIPFILLCSVGSRQTSFVLGPFSANLYFAVALLLEFLLCLAPWADDLSYIVDEGVICLRNIYLLVLLRWLVITRRHKSWIHLNDLSYEPISLLDILILESLVTSIGSQARLCVIYWLRTWRPQIRIILLLKILQN